MSQEESSNETLPRRMKEKRQAQEDTEKRRRAGNKGGTMETTAPDRVQWRQLVIGATRA